MRRSIPHFIGNYVSQLRELTLPMSSSADQVLEMFTMYVQNLLAKHSQLTHICSFCVYPLYSQPESQLPIMATQDPRTLDLGRCWGWKPDWRGCSFWRLTPTFSEESQC